MTQAHIKKRTLSGVVVSAAMNKTVVVRVDRVKTHPRYKKQYWVSKKFKAHDERNEFKVGERVLITETRPRSREKRFRVVKRIEEGRRTSE